MKKFIILFAIIALSVSARAQAPVPGNFVTDSKLWTSAYQQKAAEYKALCFQAYNIAHLRLQMALLKKSAKPRVIVTDIDETLLDNSPNSVHQALLGQGYTFAAWTAWTAMAKADTVPGGASFLKYAAKKGVTIYYITNRAESERAATLKNLKLYGFPNADDAHLILKAQDAKTSSKEDRRLVVAKNHNIIMLLGDNLGDFSDLWDSKTIDERAQNVRKVSASFGNRFIIIPNPNYGDWENVIYNYNNTLTFDQKEAAFKSILINEN